MQKGMDEDTRYIHDILRQKRERAQQGEEKVDKSRQL